MRMRHNVICGLSGYTVFLHINSQMAPFLKQKLLNVKRVFCLKTFHILRRLEGVMMKSVYWSSCNVPLFLVKPNFARQIFEKRSNIKFYENQDRGNRVVPCARTDGKTEISKLFVAFRNFFNTPDKSLLNTQSLFVDLGCSSG
jgi:hypothetical protein